MTRNDLADRIDYAERDLAFLKQIKTNCTTCDDYQKGACRRYGPVPSDFVQQGCSDWNFDDVPF